MKENILLAFSGVWTHKLRSFLTMLGIIIGIASIITIVSTIKGTNEQIKQNLIGAGNNAVVVQVYRDDYPLSFDYEEAPDGIAELDEITRSRLENLEGAEDASAFYSREYTEGIYWKNTGFNGNLYGVDDHYLGLYGYRVLYGRAFTEHDYETASKCAVLDSRAASSIFGGVNPLGEILEICGEPFTVVGVAEITSDFEPSIKSMSDYYMYADTSAGTVFVTDTVWPMLYRFDEPRSAAVRARSTDEMTAVSQRAGNLLTEVLVSPNVREMQNISYKGRDLLEDAQQLQQIATSTSRQLVWIAGISLLVGGIGVMNIMLVSVTERTREIGLKKAIGAKRRRILGQFLTEAAVLTSIGGILGVIFGIVLAKLISRFSGAPTAISLPAIAAATVFSVVIGIVFGLLPAIKASKLNPIEALRRE